MITVKLRNQILMQCLLGITQLQDRLVTCVVKFQVVQIEVCFPDFNFDADSFASGLRTKHIVDDFKDRLHFKGCILENELAVLKLAQVNQVLYE